MSCNWHSTTEQLGSSVNASDLYSGCTQFTSRGWQRIKQNSQQIKTVPEFKLESSRFMVEISMKS